MRSRFLIFLSFLMALAVFAKGQSALRAKRHLEKDNLERVIKIVERSVSKAPADPANHFILAQYFIHPDFGFTALDSANLYSNLARAGWNEVEEDEKKKYSRKGMDSLSISFLSLKIDSLAFENAKSLNTEEGFNHFINNYEKASQLQEAVDLRNEVAYQSAVAKNSVEAMEEFFKNYPEAKQAKNARDIYETLYYEKFTKDKTLASYEQYLVEKPQSALREEAAHQILKIISTGANPAVLKNFVGKYPNTAAAASANNLLSYWNDENLLSPLMVHYKSGQYYFFDTETQQLLDFNLTDLEMDSCGWIFSGLIPGKNKEKWYDRSGNLFLDGSFSSLEYLQSGFFKVFYPTKTKASLIHISKDSSLTQSATDFKNIDPYFLARKIGQKWQLTSLLGEEILSQPVDSIWTRNNLYLFQNSGRMALATREDLTKKGQNDLKTLSLLYTDFEFYDNGAIWLASNEYQSVLDAGLKPMIPLKKVKINKIAVGWIIQNESEMAIYTDDFESKMSLEAESFKANKELIALKNEGKWALINQKTSFPEFTYDSVRLFNSWLSYAEVAKQRYLIFSNGVILPIDKNELFKILKTYNEAVVNSEENVRFLEIVNNKGYVKIYNGFGHKIDEGENLKVDPLTANILQVNAEGSKLLIDSAGNKLLKEKVDAFGSMQEGLIPILKNKKFGAYQISRKQIIPFKSDVKIQVFVSDSLFIFQKEARLGIMDATGKEILENEYRSIEYLNDSLAFVEVDTKKSLINIRTKEVIIEAIQVLEKVSFQQKNYFVIRLSAGYGMINSAAEEVIPFIFNAIQPIKLGDQLIWKAERRITEMDYQVIAYFSATGELLFREGFTNEEYLKTACD